MITIKVTRNELNAIVNFTMSGHADAGPYGYDLVCAGASAVSIGTINAITEICNIDLHIEMEDEGGFLHCRVPDHLDDATAEKVQLLLEGMLVSLHSIAAEYSEHIEMKDIARR